MTEGKTVLVRVDSQMGEQLRWLLAHEKVVAKRAKRRAKSVPQLLRDIAGGKVAAAFGKIEPWVKSVQAAQMGA